MAAEPVAVRLEGGEFGSHQAVYSMEWPPPEEILACQAEGMIAVAPADQAARLRELGYEPRRYRKVKQSGLPEGASLGDAPVVRGARYEATP
jgi:hypothetical protein